MAGGAAQHLAQCVATVESTPDTAKLECFQGMMSKTLLCPMARGMGMRGGLVLCRLALPCSPGRAPRQGRACAA